MVNAFQITKAYFSFDAGRIFAPLGTVRHRGVEASLAGHFGKRFHLLAGAVLMQPRVIGAARDLGLVGERRAEDRRPDTDDVGAALDCRLEVAGHPHGQDVEVVAALEPRAVAYAGTTPSPIKIGGGSDACMSGGSVAGTTTTSRGASPLLPPSSEPSTVTWHGVNGRLATMPHRLVELTSTLARALAVYGAAHTRTS